MRYMMKHLFHICNLDIERVEYPAELRDDGKEAVLYEIYDDCDLINAFTTFKQAVNFALAYVEDHNVANRLSADRNA